VPALFLAEAQAVQGAAYRVVRQGAIMVAGRGRRSGRSWSKYTPNFEKSTPISTPRYHWMEIDLYGLSRTTERHLQREK
jgi:hypothetical protein